MILLVCVYGILIGSFLNVLIVRIPKSEDFVKTRSHCISCNYTLKWYDLVPVFSYLALGGKCRKCGRKISIRYPLVEIINGLMYAFIYYRFGLTSYGIVACIMFSTLLVISLIDLDEMIIPNKLVIFILIVASIYTIIDKNYLDHIIGFFLVSSILLFIVVVTKGAMGMGDVKLMAVSGLLLGAYNIFLALIVASVVGSIVSITLLALKKINRKNKVPFGPFLSFGIMVAIVFGEQIINWYFNVFI